MLVSILVTGCSVEEVQETLSIGDSALKQDLTGNWFGRKDAESRDGNSAYGNGRDPITHNLDITEVGESKLGELPVYDFKGPDPAGPAAGTTDDSLLVSSDTEGEKETSENEKAVVYLAPLYSGFEWDKKTVRIRSNGLYSTFLQHCTKNTYEKFCAEYYTKRGNDLKNMKTDGFGQSTFKGGAVKYNSASGTVSLPAWVLTWNICRAVGKKLTADGYTVVYPDSTDKNAEPTSSANTFFAGNSKLKDVNEIAKDAIAQRATCVIFIGFNEKGMTAFTGGDDVPWRKTIFAYHSYKVGDKEISNKGFTKKLKADFSTKKDLRTSRLGTLEFVNAFGKTYGKSYSTITEYGMQKAQVSLRALQIQQYNGKSATIMLGNSYQNISINANSTGGLPYDYAKPKELGKAIAVSIEKSL